jgi:ABC-type phosphate/phosphonate transport system substrate-binding protein
MPYNHTFKNSWFLFALVILGSSLPRQTLHGQTLASQSPAVLPFATQGESLPTVDAQRYLPYLDALTKELSREIGPVQLPLLLVGSVRTWEETMAEHPKLLVRLEPQRFYDMTLQGRGLTPLVMESRNDQKFQKGHLIISNALVHLTQNQLQQLPLALVDPQDASGGTLAKAALFILGYRGPHFPKITYLGRHDKVLYAVANAEYGIGAVNDHVFQRYYRQKQIVSLTQSPSPEPFGPQPPRFRKHGSWHCSAF